MLDPKVTFCRYCSVYYKIIFAKIVRAIIKQNKAIVAESSI